MTDESLPSGVLKVADLLPCPFCGGKADGPKRDGGSDERNGYNFRVLIGCRTCGATRSTDSHQDRNGWCDDSGQAENSAIEAWNRRASPPPQATGALSEQKIDAIVLLAEKMMRDSWATGADSAWHPARDDLRAALSSAKREAEPLTDAKVIAMNPYLNDEGRRALWLAAFRMAEKHHGITAASQVEPEDKQPNCALLLHPLKGVRDD